MTAINTGNFVSDRRGGTLQVIDLEASTTYEVSGVDEDSIESTAGMYAVIADTESGAPSNERRGDKQRSTITMRFKQTKDMVNASALYGLLLDQVKGSDDGLVRLWDVIWKQTDHAGDVTGESETWANCFVVPGSVRRRSGAEYNTIECQFSSRVEAPAFGTF